MRERIQGALRSALSKIGITVEQNAVPLEFTGNLKNGDFASSIALQHAKEAGMAPRELAEKILAVLSEMEGVEKVDIAGPGFINFYLEPEVFADVIQEVTANPDRWGRNGAHEGKKIMVEYTDPNPFKEFHI